MMSKHVTIPVELPLDMLWPTGKDTESMWSSLLVREPRSALIHVVVNNRNMEPRCENGAIQVYKFMSPQDPVAESAKGFASILVPYRGSVFSSSRAQVSVFHQQMSF